MKDNGTNYRQGDVYIIGVDKLPKGLKKKEKDNCLAYGEVTGHQHEVFNGEVLCDDQGNLFFKATEDTTVGHVDQSGRVADHDTIGVAPGNYRVVIQEEYEPDGWRQVID